MSAKRRVEVFTAGCSLRDETVKLVKELACPSCEVNIYGLSKSGMEKAKEYGVNSVPAVVVDGKIAECCIRGTPNIESLKVASIGRLP